MAAEAAACKHCLARRQLANADRRHIVGMLRHEVAIDRLIVLPVVTDQQPLDLRELARQALQTAALVLATTAEPPIRWPPVGQQQSTGRIQVAGQKRVKVGATFHAPVER